MARKIKYSILDDIEQTVVVVFDGSVATAHNNDEHIVINWYSNKIPTVFNEDKIDETIWQYLDKGRRYWKDFPTKQEVDDEIIIDMLLSVYGEVEFEKDDEVDCFCGKDLRKFLNKNQTNEKN